MKSAASAVELSFKEVRGALGCVACCCFAGVAAAIVGQEPRPPLQGV
jgi:hypothetical protein